MRNMPKPQKGIYRNNPLRGKGINRILRATLRARDEDIVNLAGTAVSANSDEAHDKARFEELKKITHTRSKKELVRYLLNLHNGERYGRRK